VCYQNGYFRHAPNLRIRPVRELQLCVVFSPKIPKLYMLNLNAWLIFELCAKTVPDRLKEEYLSAVGTSLRADLAQDQLRRGLEQLIARGLIEFVPAEGRRRSNIGGFS
jgi:hypothetical protein